MCSSPLTERSQCSEHGDRCSIPQTSRQLRTANKYKSPPLAIMAKPQQTTAFLTGSTESAVLKSCENNAKVLFGKGVDCQGGGGETYLKNRQMQTRGNALHSKAGGGGQPGAYGCAVASSPARFTPVHAHTNPVNSPAIARTANAATATSSGPQPVRRDKSRQSGRVRRG